jgi:hypothetical protein
MKYRGIILEKINVIDSINPLDPFFVLHDYRKTAKLKKMREIRKKKIFAAKMMQRKSLDSKKMEKLERLNKSMLDEDNIWGIMHE